MTNPAEMRFYEFVARRANTLLGGVRYRSGRAPLRKLDASEIAHIEQLLIEARATLHNDSSLDTNAKASKGDT